MVSTTAALRSRSSARSSVAAATAASRLRCRSLERRRLPLDAGGTFERPARRLIARHAAAAALERRAGLALEVRHRRAFVGRARLPLIARRRCTLIGGHGLALEARRRRALVRRTRLPLIARRGRTVVRRRRLALVAWHRRALVRARPRTAERSVSVHVGTTVPTAASACDRTKEIGAALLCDRSTAATVAVGIRAVSAGRSRRVGADTRAPRCDRTADRTASETHRAARPCPFLVRSGRGRCRSPLPMFSRTSPCAVPHIRARPTPRRSDRRRCRRGRAFPHSPPAAGDTRVLCRRASSCRRAGPRATRSGSPHRSGSSHRHLRRTHFEERRRRRADTSRDCLPRIQTVRDSRRSRRDSIPAARQRAAAALRVRIRRQSTDRLPHGGHRPRRG